MKRFIVNSNLPQSKSDGIALVRSVPKMLKDEKIKDVKLTTAYCCTPEGKIIAEFEGPDKETVSSALNKIGMPFTTVTEATKIV